MAGSGAGGLKGAERAGDGSSAEVRLTLLGAVEASRDGQPLLLGPPQRKAVLCALALRPRRWVSAQSLLDALYEDAAPASGVAVVQTHVAGLRRVLEPARRPRSPFAVLLSGHGGYRLEIEDGQTDLGVFDRLVAGGEHARDRADWAAADAHYSRALRLYRGEPLAGLPGPYAAMWRSTLTERHLSVLEDGLEVTLALGRTEQAVERLRVLTAEHPLRERLRALLMRALHLAGRQSEALDVYARTRRLLVGELGVEPGPELRELHRRILSGPPTLPDRAPGRTTDSRATDSQAEGAASAIRANAAPAGSARKVTGPTAAHPAGPSALGNPGATPLTDREDQLATVLALAARAGAGEGGLVLVSGVHGHGKSRFLSEVAGLLPGARRIDLAVGHAESAPAALLRALGHSATAPAPALADGPSAEQLRRALLDATGSASPVVLVDDVAPPDESATALLAELALRLRGSGVLLVLAVEDRPWEPARHRDVALANAAAAVLHLGRFTEQAVAELVARKLGAPGADGLALSIHQATAGIPLLVAGLVADLCGLPAPDHVPSHAADGHYLRALASMLDAYSPERSLLLRAVAVLQEHRPTPELLAAVTEEPLSTVRDRCERLVTIGVLASADPPRFRHPVVANALRWLCTPEENARLRVAAARHALVSGHGARQAASLLDDLTGPGWSEWTDVHLAAARDCLRHHQVPEALRHLQAALRIASPAQRDPVLVQLGQLELWVNPAASLAHLQEALRDQRAALRPPTALVPLAWTMASHRQAGAALALLTEVTTETEPRDPAAARALRASAWMVAALTHEGWAAYVAALRADPSAADDPVAAAVLTWDDAFGVRCSATEAMARFPAEHSADGAWGRLPGEVIGILTHIAMWADDLTLAGQLSDLDEDRHFGTVDVYRRIVRSEVHLRQGEYRLALAECAPVVGLPVEQVPRRPAALVAQYAHALLGLGRLTEAEEWLDGVAEHANPESWEWTVVKYVRALVCSARGQAQQAAAHFLDCGRRNSAWGLDNPAHIAWRSSAAVELMRVGAEARARELALAELELARRWDTPVTLGRAWRAVALTYAGGPSLPLLERAVDFLRAGQAVGVLVPALLDLAAARSAAGHHAQADALLTEARHLAEPRGIALP
ncbi:BTAD domain-containing putative transcriptional regulator [Kitasatospora albolonga]|uniref:BTAD domain-containing putative transcriptional regulator n=1 Tax=Kitasatospora albolonga TaxID=68173 RepID=UPI0035EB9F38